MVREVPEYLYYCEQTCEQTCKLEHPGSIVSLPTNETTIANAPYCGPKRMENYYALVILQRRFTSVTYKWQGTALVLACERSFFLGIVTALTTWDETKLPDRQR